MKKIFIIITLLATISGVSAQDAEYQLIRRHYTLNEDGSLDIHYRKELKLLRNRAITAYADKGETFILYNPATDRLTINESHTLRKDGSKVQTPQNAFIDQLPSSCENCGRYNGLRERVVVHTALEYDCTIVLDYTLHRAPLEVKYETVVLTLPPYLEEQLQMEQDCPVKKYELIVDAPANQFAISHSSTHGKHQVLADGHRYHAIFTDLEQTYNNAYLPESHRIYNTIHFTLGEKATQEMLIDDNPTNRVPEAANLLVELYQQEPLAYATAIRDYVVDHIRLNDIPMSLLSHRVAPARTTFNSSCGTAADKANLLMALLHQAGIGNSTLSNDNESVILQPANDAAKYQISVRNKKPLRHMDATPKTTQQTTDTSTITLLWEGSPIGGGFKQMTLPAPQQPLGIDPSRLTSERTAPLAAPSYSSYNHYQLILPRTPKHLLVGKPVLINRQMAGVGSIYISIKQLGNGSIDIVRKLTLDAPSGIIEGKKAYQFFRQMMIDWHTYNTITIKAAPATPTASKK